jgi:hypothetical protein
MSRKELSLKRLTVGSWSEMREIPIPPWSVKFCTQGPLKGLPQGYRLAANVTHRPLVALGRIDPLFRVIDRDCGMDYLDWIGWIVVVVIVLLVLFVGWKYVF